MDRRDLLKFGMAGAAAIPLSSFNSIDPGFLTQWEGKRILFQGDSITDGGRDRENLNPNNPWALGQGYVFYAAGWMLKNSPEFEFEVFNRGISGNKVFQLDERWEVDCLEIQPELVSILIGVNDFWHTLSSGYEGTAEIFERDYRALLHRTFEQLPNASVIIGEPFVVKGGTAITDDWFPAFAEYQEIALKLAREYNTGFVPYQAYFDKALETAPVSYWCPDGVHPSIAGSVMMAEAWMETFKRM